MHLARPRRFARLGDEVGQSLVLIVVSMVVILGMAAVGIDLASWYQRHHQAQVAADAAALAAANYMENGGSAATATTMATSYASSNQATLSSNNVTVDAAGKTVTVQVSLNAPSLFAGLFGIHNAVASVQSKAAWGNTTCAATGTSGSNCFAIFAYDSAADTANSTSAGADGVTNNGNGSTAINGTVHSNGSIYNNGYAQALLGPDNTYGTASGDLNANATLGANNIPFPLDYTAASTATNYGALPNGGPLSLASGTTAPAMTGCTYTYTGDVTLSGSWPAGVYCATGTITIGKGSATASGNNTGATYEASQIVVNGNGGTLEPYNWPGNPVLFYASYGGWNAANNTGCSSSSTGSTLGINFGGNSKVITEGYGFAPCSSIYFTSNTAAWSPAFLEAYNVNLAGANFQGDGPQTDSTGTVSNTDHLTG